MFSDRQRRKAKLVVDTAGIIASALERAYRYGFEDAQREGLTWNRTVAINEDAVEWITIPPRAREAFEVFAYSSLGQNGLSEREAHYIPNLTERGTPGWLLIWAGKLREASPLEDAKSAVAQQTIAILLRLGLVMFADADGQKIVISERGRKTWATFRENASG